MGVRGPGFAILARVAEVGNDGCDAARGRALQRIDQDQQFHEVVVGGKRGRLDDEHVLAAHVFLDLDEDFHVGEALHLALGHGQLQVGADRVCERAVGVAGDNLHVRRSPALSRAASVTGIERHWVSLPVPQGC